MKRFFNTLFLLLFAFSAFAQQNIDSLRAVIENGNLSRQQTVIVNIDLANQLIDTNPFEALKVLKKALLLSDVDIPAASHAKGLLLCGLAYQHMGYKDSSFTYYKDAIMYSKIANIPHLLASSYSFMAVLNCDFKLYEESIINLRKGINVLNQHNIQDDQLGEFFTNLGLCFNKQNQNDSAIIYYNKAIAHYKSLNNETDMAVALNNVGQLYEKIEKPDEALLHYMKAAAINRKSQNNTLLINNLNNIALYYKSKAKFPKALEIFEEVDSIARPNHFSKDCAINYFNRANVYYLMNDPGSARTYYITSLELCYELNLTYGVILNKLHYARIFADNKQFEIADSLWDETKKLINTNEYPSLLVNLEEIKAESYEKNGLIKKALASKSLQLHYTDSLKNQSQEKLMNSLVKLYETERKSHTIQLQQIQLNAAQKQLFLAIAGFLVFMVLSIILYFVLRSSRQKNRVLFGQITEMVKLDTQQLSHQQKLLDSNQEMTQFEVIFYRLNKLIHKNEIYLDPQITRNKMALLANTNEKYLGQAVKDQISMSLGEYLNRHRIFKAISLLEEYPEMTIIVMAEKSGFNSERTFYRIFKQTTGITPMQYMKLSAENRTKLKSSFTME